jgi:hypothetical protein
MEWISSPNYDKGRGGKKIENIIVHWFGMGTIDGAIATFKKTGGTSAHYLVSNDRVVQMVKDENTAYHCGIYAYNQKSLGIEHDATTEHDLSQESYQTSGKLIRELCDKYGIPLDRDHIKKHSEIKATACPGTVDLDKLIKIAKESEEEVSEEECKKRIEEALKGKIDENQTKKLMESGFRYARATWLGEVDEPALQRDVDFRWGQIVAGSQFAFKEQIEDYMKAGNLQWVKKGATDSACQVELAQVKEKINKAKEILK